MKKIILYLLLLISTYSYSKDYVIVYENENASNWATLPYVKTLINNGSYFSNFHAISHPSLLNYLYLFSGSTQGITNDNNPGFKKFNLPNLSTRLSEKGKRFLEYEDALPSIGYIGAWSTGTWYGKHCPAISFNIDQTCRIPFSQFSLANNGDVVFIIPDINHCGHDGGIQNFDNWMKTDPKIQSLIAEAKDSSKNTRVWIWADENDGGGTNQVDVGVFGKGVKKGFTISKYADHSTLLRILCELNGAAYPVNNASSSIMDWRDTVIAQPIDTTHTPVDTIKLCWKKFTKDSVIVGERDSSYTATQKVPTYTHVTKQDSVKVACDTVPTDTTHQVLMYMAHADTKIGTPAKETVAVNYAKQVGVTGYIPYNTTGYLNDGGAKYKSFQIKCHANGLKLGAVYGSMAELDLIISKIKPDFITSEFEAYSSANGGGMDAVVKDSLMRYKANQFAKSLGIESILYTGWPKSPPMQANAVGAYASELVRLDDVINVHAYRTKLDSDYVQTRLDIFNPLIVGTKKIGTIESFEPIFMGNGLTKLSDIRPYFEKLFKRYPKMIYDRDVYFTDDHLMVIIPYKTTNLFRMVFPVKYADPEFQKTSPNAIDSTLMKNTTPE